MTKFEFLSCQAYSWIVNAPGRNPLREIDGLTDVFSKKSFEGNRWTDQCFLKDHGSSYNLHLFYLTTILPKITLASLSVQRNTPISILPSVISIRKFMLSHFLSFDLPFSTCCSCKNQGKCQVGMYSTNVAG